MNKLKLIALAATLTALFSCSSQHSKTVKAGYLKDNISQTELQNPSNYKHYYYSCRNFETGADSYLSTYCPLSRESRMKENFGS